MKVVALVPGGIGDQILFFPTLDRLKQSYPKAEIDVIVEPRSKGAYRVSQSVNDVFAFDFKDRNSPADWGNLLGILRDREYEIALSLGQRWTVGLLLWLTGIPTRISYQGPGSMFLSNPIPLKTEQYAAHMYYDLLQGLGITSPCPELSINVPKKDIEWAEKQQQDLGIGEGGYLLIHGGSSQLAQTKGIDKIYPVAKWQEIVQTLNQQQPDLPIVVLKGPEDEALVNQLLQGNPNLKVTSPPDIGKLAAMIANANLMLCTDSAPMHLSVAVKTFTIALFGPTEPKKLLPASDKYIGISSPTGKMADITSQMVLEKILGS
ncbi:glycosyltransferase family 9 protein [Roseofilum reptotaenium CS-1145]|uniref:Glycosyltransferase n=1 Tax=Roseofilum reptotaenium AO1-A TaxID=1925591 RepID=A0A1L9QXW5_9CYAN|nr:glycosyltransferase family 9 protein [Roseofilum reptotaenium]MDB9517828.1 glycosyltransferase family 9 protein [Roseofilum reptotaenium CS-1145]OJJ27520.1 glycosyltransferase [Roseofilum reptotaenium AO1-A]